MKNKKKYMLSTIFWLIAVVFLWVWFLLAPLDSFSETKGTGQLPKAEALYSKLLGLIIASAIVIFLLFKIYDLKTRATDARQKKAIKKKLNAFFSSVIVLLFASHISYWLIKLIWPGSSKTIEFGSLITNFATILSFLIAVFAAICFLCYNLKKGVKS